MEPIGQIREEQVRKPLWALSLLSLQASSVQPLAVAWPLAYRVQPLKPRLASAVR